MKKRVIIFVAVIIIAITSILFINKSFIKDSQDYLKGILETAKPQNISIFMLPAIPILTIISPENTTYSTSTIFLNYSVRNEVESVWYNLDSLENITITSPLYFSAAEGSHILYLYANNSQGTSFKSVIFSIEIETPPSGGSNGGGGGGGAGEVEPIKENITIPEEVSPNLTDQEIPENITQKPEEKPTSTREITIKFLISLLLLVLLIILVIILIIITKRRLKKEKQKKKK